MSEEGLACACGPARAQMVAATSPKDVRAVWISPTAKRDVTVHWDEGVRLWDKLIDRLIAELPHRGMVYDAAFISTRNVLVTVDANWHQGGINAAVQTLRFWIGDGQDLARAAGLARHPEGGSGPAGGKTLVTVAPSVQSSTRPRARRSDSRGGILTPYTASRFIRRARASSRVRRRRRFASGCNDGGHDRCR